MRACEGLKGRRFLLARRFGLAQGTTVLLLLIKTRDKPHRTPKKKLQVLYPVTVSCAARMSLCVLGEEALVLNTPNLNSTCWHRIILRSFNNFALRC